jgi:hypothetical protein
MMEGARNTYGIYDKKYKILVKISEARRPLGSPSHKRRIILECIVRE